MSVKIIDGRTIEYRPISDFIGEEKGKRWGKSTWSVVTTSNDNPHISLQLERLEKCGPIDRKPDYNEIVYVQDGELIITSEGQPHHLYQGDVMIVTSGDIYVFEVPEYVALLIVYHPPLDKCVPYIRTT